MFAVLDPLILFFDFSIFVLDTFDLSPLLFFCFFKFLLGFFLGLFFQIFLPKFFVSLLDILLAGHVDLFLFLLFFFLFFALLLLSFDLLHLFQTLQFIISLFDFLSQFIIFGCGLERLKRQCCLRLTQR